MVGRTPDNLGRVGQDVAQQNFGKDKKPSRLRNFTGNVCAVVSLGAGAKCLADISVHDYGSAAADAGVALMTFIPAVTGRRSS